MSVMGGTMKCRICGYTGPACLFNGQGECFTCVNMLFMKENSYARKPRPVGSSDWQVIRL